MSPQLYERILRHAFANRHRPVWKARLIALLYGASLRTIARIK